MNLSGGQQARINLARAIYKDSEIYLLDDSLTALDPVVQDYIFEECIQKFLANKIVVMVSQIAYHIEEANTVIVLSNRKIKSIGKPSGEVLQDVSLAVTPDRDDLKVEEQTELQKPLDQEEKAGEKQEKAGEQKSVYGEVKKKGEVDYSTYRKYFAYGGGILLMLVNGIIFVCSQTAESYSDMLLTHW